MLSTGSNSKTFTAALAGLLHEDPRVDLQWTSKVSDLLPEYQPQDPDTRRRADLTDIMSHCSGLPRHDLAPQLGETLEDAVSHHSVGLLCVQQKDLLTIWTNT